ncbi:hypothetical protein ACSMXN_08515 [Jatrophihabitans sp. DSM 45814]
MIPAEMTGGWVRNGITMNGAEPAAENTVVWWLQAPTKHCDLRVPHEGTDGVMSFAGTTSWAEPSLTWSPEIELDRSIFEDVGVISWDGNDLIETGVSYEGERTISYVERWQRLPGGSGELLALSSPSGRLVRTGRYALTIVDQRLAGGTFAAVAWIWQGEEWVIDHCWPVGATAPAPPASVGDGQATVVLSDGIEWTVDEHWKVSDISG